MNHLDKLRDIAAKWMPQEGRDEVEDWIAAGSGQAVTDVDIFNLMIEESIAYRDDRRPDRVLMFPLNSGEIKDCIKKAIAKFSAPIPQEGADAVDAARWRFIVNDGKSLQGRFTLVKYDERTQSLIELTGDQYVKAVDAARAQRASEKEKS